MKITDHLGNLLQRDDIVPALGLNGIVRISESSREEFTDYFSPSLKIFPHPHATDNGWTLIRPYGAKRARPGENGFTNAALSPHTDRSFLQRPPSVLCFLLLETPASGGEAILVDTASVYRGFSIEELYGIQNELWLKDSCGRKRRQVFTVDDGLCINRYRVDQLAAPTATSKYAQSLLTELQLATRRPTHIELRQGEGYLIHNHRFLHGRREFSGARLGARLLATVADNPSYEWINQGFTIDR